MKLPVATFYLNRSLYRYMPRAIFDALEMSFLLSATCVTVPDNVGRAFRLAVPDDLWPLYPDAL